MGVDGIESKWWGDFKRLAYILSQPHKRSQLQRYIFPLVLLAIVFFFKVTIIDQLGPQTPFLLLTSIVVLSAWFGGFGPGVLATLVTGLLSNYLLLHPKLGFDGLESVLTTLIFVIQGIFISMISEAKRQTDLQKDEFISFASHELRNPLAVIKGYIAVSKKLAERYKDKKLALYLEKSDTSVDKTNTLIHELLDLTKIESGKLSLSKEIFEIFNLVKGVVKDQQLITETHKILLKGKSNKKVLGDKYRIGQILTNLITNAVKYSPGKKQVIISITNKSGFVIITVQDFGLGISENESRKVFDRFYRVSNSKISGLGLGLYISQQIALLHNGRIWVESNKDKGSTFYFQLPTRGK